MKNKIGNSKGVTLIALVITIIVLLILASVATYSGVGVIRSSQFTTFITELKIMQTQVNSLYDQWKSGNIKIDDTNGTITNASDNSTIGKDLTYNSTVQEQANTVLVETLGLASNIADLSNYKYFDQETLQNLRIESITREFFINIKTRSVVSYEGYTYEGVTYYTLDQVPQGLYNVDYDPQQAGDPTFDVSYEEIGENKWRVTVSNIQYDGYIDKWSVKYQKEGSEYWSTTEDMSFVVRERGTYKIKVFNGNIETSDENMKTVELLGDYIEEGLILHYDAINNTGEGDEKHSTTTTTWKDLSGNGNDGTLRNFDTTEESGWKDSYLKFDGINDIVNTGLKGATTFTSDDNYTLEVVFNMNKVTAQGNQYGNVDEGIIFGSISYCGYGIFWDTYSTDKYFLGVGHRYSDGYGTKPATELLTAISKEITNVSQLNSVSQIYNRTDNKLLMLLNSELVEEKSMKEDYEKEYDRAEPMGNILINTNTIFQRKSEFCTFGYECI